MNKQKNYAVKEIILEKMKVTLEEVIEEGGEELEIKGIAFSLMFQVEKDLGCDFKVFGPATSKHVLFALERALTEVCAEGE